MLSSQEVATLITALGCGIGPDEYDPDKIRYHRIIIMTDADVDGSHIRTLLLTLFFRYMKPLVELGHVYIAQPPLYKVKRGKQEQYVKDDEALYEYLTQSALEGAELFPSKEAPAISARALEELVLQYRRVEKIVNRHSRRYNARVLKRISYLPILKIEDFKNHQLIHDWGKQLSLSLQQVAGKNQHYLVDVVHNAENDNYQPQITLREHGSDHAITLNAEFFLSKDYKELTNLGAKLGNLVEEGARVKRGEKTQAIESFEKALEWLMEEAKRGQTIQRYKGLGEMNPEQLWETTMDPEVRRMLQVSIEDAVAADEIFTTLMGDNVEPRREFIEINALEAENIDA
jgi:DNA gyrase subunit B